MVDADGVGRMILDVAADVENHCEIGPASDRTPRLLVAETFLFSSNNEEEQVNLLFLNDVLILRTMDLYSKYTTYQTGK